MKRFTVVIYANGSVMDKRTAFLNGLNDYCFKSLKKTIIFHVLDLVYRLKQNQCKLHPPNLLHDF